MIEQISLVIVHGGIFHADDVCVVAWLRLLGYAGPVVRRNPTDKEAEDPRVLVADVGLRNEPDRNNFDHHQKGGGGERQNGVPFAALGRGF